MSSSSPSRCPSPLTRTAPSPSSASPSPRAAFSPGWRHSWRDSEELNYFYTACFMETVPSVYTLLMNTFFLSHSTQIAKETVFRKYMVSSVCFKYFSCCIHKSWFTVRRIYVYKATLHDKKPHWKKPHGLKATSKNSHNIKIAKKIFFTFFANNF